MIYLTRAPLWLSGLLLVGLTTALAMAAPVFIRRHVKLERLRINNEVAGFKFATVGVLYAVMLAFVIVVWEKFSEAERDVAMEAGAAATIFRLSDGIDGAAGATLREAVASYLRTVIAEDWPAMERGGHGSGGNRALDRVYAAALAYNPDRGKDSDGILTHRRCRAELAQQATAAPGEGVH